MKLIRAEINNFRLLKELVLNFSVDETRKLTVIRAANETGKTTCKTALLWGLFGNKSLPNNGKNYPLFPSDLVGKEARVEVSVEIEFETDQVVTLGRSNHELQKRTYRLKRSCLEYASANDQNIRRESETIVLFEHKPEGDLRIPSADVERIIESSIPLALKDVYFTDGDSAMSFIEAAATTGVKRKRVSSAIEALLGLDVLQKSTSHLAKAASRFSSMIDNTDYRSELEILNDRISGWEEDIGDWEEDRAKVATEIREGSNELSSVNSRIEEILKLGDKSKLVNDIHECVRDITRSKEGAKRALEDMSTLLNSSDLSAKLISVLAKKGLLFLNNLSDKKELPKVNIPILEELLDRDTCFCGAELSASTEKGLAARASVQKSIEASREADKLQEAGTSLFYSVRSESFENDRPDFWKDMYGVKSKDYADFTSALSSSQKKLLKLNEEKDAIDDSSLDVHRELRDTLEKKLRDANVNLGQRESSIEDAKSRKIEAEQDRQKVEKRLNKTDSSSDKLALARLVQNIFIRICDRLAKEELRKVSDQMNRIFLEMIGSDPEANDLALITKAELTNDYDILVYGPNGHALNPDQDLNGASRRAITLAFILALTKVSEVEAPNVIDTPLGMMSGFVKRSVLRRTVFEGSQIILFLTHGEISGVEDILDEVAGKIYTLTNPGHFPRMLANRTDVNDSRIVRCECDHRKTCIVCERLEEDFAA